MTPIICSGYDGGDWVIEEENNVKEDNNTFDLLSCDFFR